MDVRISEPITSQLGLRIPCNMIICQRPLWMALILARHAGRATAFFMTSAQTALARGIVDTSRVIYGPLRTFSKVPSTDAEEWKLDFESLDRRGNWLQIDWNAVMTQHVPTGPSTKVIDPTTAPSRQNNLDHVFHRPTQSPDQPSPVEVALVRDRIVYIKRDDLLRLRHSHVSGNKARKLLGLNEIPLHLFPRALVSFGGPQSNAMLAIAAIVNAKNREYLAEAFSQVSTPTGPSQYLSIPDENDTTVQDHLYELDSDWIDTEIQSSLDPYPLDTNALREPLLSSQEAAKILVEDDNTNVNSLLDDQPFFSRQGNKNKRFRFIYYTKKLPRYLRKQPNGNLLRALSLGMELVELSPTDYGKMFSTDQGGSPLYPPISISPPIPGQSLWIPQGGACSIAIPGTRLLAQEILHYWSQHGRSLPLSVIVPGGTCTTAMLLSREIDSLVRSSYPSLDIKVVVIPCVGDEVYSMKQMENLSRHLENTDHPTTYPTILKPLTEKRHHVAKGDAKSNGYFVFGEPATPILETFLEMKEEYGIYLDLLYGAPAWTLLLQRWTSEGQMNWFSNRDEDCPLRGRQLMYVHSGGLEGVSSQLTRYRHKGLVDAREIQPS